MSRLFARKRLQNRGKCFGLAIRLELCSEPGEVENRQTTTFKGPLATCPDE
jgi:hypothetical protein